MQQLSCLHNSQHICLPRHSLISYLSPVKALLKQSRVIYKICNTSHTNINLLTLVGMNELTLNITCTEMNLNQPLALSASKAFYPKLTSKWASGYFREASILIDLYGVKRHQKSTHLHSSCWQPLMSLELSSPDQNNWVSQRR